MRKLVFAPRARRDLAEIALYIAEAAGRNIATEVVRRIRVKCALIAETSGEIGTSRTEIREGLRSFPVAPYVLFFRYTEREVQVVRILHERRDVEETLR